MYLKIREVEGERVNESVSMFTLDDDTSLYRMRRGSSEISRSIGREITGIEYVQIPLHSRERKMMDGVNERWDVELRDGHR